MARLRSCRPGRVSARQLTQLRPVDPALFRSDGETDEERLIYESREDEQRPETYEPRASEWQANFE